MLQPQLASSILLAPVETGYVAYDTAADRLHRLNATASLIVELCDGTRTVTQIETAVTPLLPPGHSTAVKNWIEDAAQQGLLVDGVDRSAERAQLSAKQLATLADRLREHGKIRTAFLCQRRAAEMKPRDAAHWSHLGELAHIAGRRDDARQAYEHYLTLEPEDAEVRHILTALRDETPPIRVPDECIEQLYERFSTFYESNLVDQLEYAAPERLSDALDAVLPGRADLRTLDLGCGTGLSGAMLRRRAAQLDGIDLSPEMVAQARKRQLYDRLAKAEITAWLDSALKAQKRYDLIVACDTLIYFGDLGQVVGPAAGLLADGGVIAFSVERGNEPPYRLMDSGRYVHHVQHITEVAAAAGLEVIYHRESFLRMEYGEEVMGHVVVLGAVTPTRQASAR
jgi:predicted TPR repeat methyltransferase